MLKGLKIFAWLAGSVLLVIVAASIALPLFFDPNDFKPQITGLVKEKTGRDLVMEGDITLSVFPWLGIKTGALALSNAPGFGTQPFVSADSAEVRVKLMPLLYKEVQLDTVGLHGLALHLGKDKSGKTNWADLVSGHENGEGKNPLASLAALAIGGGISAMPPWSGMTKRMVRIMRSITLICAPARSLTTRRLMSRLSLRSTAGSLR